MGVMNCSRPGCESILCETNVNGIGYVCGSCKSEFHDSMGNKKIPRSEMKNEFKKFMTTEKRDEPGDIDSHDFFDLM